MLTSDLPPELAGLILRWLPWQLDRLNFRAVCRQWRRRLPPSLPLICLNNGKFQSLTVDEPPRRRLTPPDLLGGTVAACFGCYDDWLLYCDVLGAVHRRRCFLLNPLSGATMADITLPPSDYSESGIFPVRKVIVCSPDLIAAKFTGAIGFYRLGAQSWLVCEGWYMEDITLYQGKIYAVNHNNELFAQELPGEKDAVVKLSKLAIMADRLSSSDLGLRAYLVVSCGKLLMVRWSLPSRERSSAKRLKTTEGTKLRVYEADLEMGRWLEVNDLDSQAIFIGRGCSKALCLKGDDPRFQGNRVYFLGSDFRDCFPWLRHVDTPSYGFYDIRSGTTSKIFLSARLAMDVWRMEWFFPCE
ncbi:hypothetical protein ACP70R_021524 [Stipagrostis hirtigluma subsp. patula]